MRSRCWPAFVVFWAVALSVSGCGSPAPPATGREATPPAPASAKAEDKAVKGPCALVTKPEAEAVLRTEIKPGSDEGPERINDATRTSCFYRSDNGTLQVTLHRFDSAATAAARYATLRKRYRGSDSPDVAGVGDDAFWTNEELVVRAADVRVHIRVEFADERELKSHTDKQAVDALIAVEKQLAAQVLQRVAQAPGS